MDKLDSALLEPFDDDDRARVREALSPELTTYEDGDYLCQAGQAGNCLWVIDSGRAEIVAPKPNVRTIAFRSAGEVIGEQALVEKQYLRTADVVARGPVSVHIVYIDAIEGLHDADKVRLLRGLLSTISSKLAQATHQRSDLISQGEISRGLLKRLVNPDGIAAFRELIESKTEQYQSIKAIILFTDIKGFSAIAKENPPEDTARIIRKVMSSQISAIQEADGYVDKLMGDGLMAYWQVRNMSEDSLQDVCCKAVKGAEAAFQRVGQFGGSDENINLGLRAGLHFGHVYKGNFGSEERWAYTLIGEAVNFAARLEQAKEGKNHEELGDIRLSHALHENLSDELKHTYSHAVPIKVKETEEYIYTSTKKTP